MAGPERLADEVDEGSLGGRVRGLMARARDDFGTLVAFPSVADPRQFPAAGCRQAADFVARSFAWVGLPDVRILDTPDGHQAVFGQCPGPPGSPTVLLYSHYDVQPPLDEKIQKIALALALFLTRDLKDTAGK